MNTTLLIMAAGIGSRFGTGIKQLEPVDASNHIIMDYSIHDAIEAGFNHVVFIIRIKNTVVSGTIKFQTKHCKYSKEVEEVLEYLRTIPALLLLAD